MKESEKDWVIIAVTAAGVQSKTLTQNMAGGVRKL